MTEARSLYRLTAALAVLGCAVVVVVLAVVVGAFDVRVPPVDELRAACHRLLPAFGIGQILALALAVLGATVLWRGMRALVHQVNAQRRFLRNLPGAERRLIWGTAVIVVDDLASHAFCAGLLRPRVYVSRGAIETLPEPQLRAVVAHERHHQERRDPLRICTGRVLGEALFFLPALRRSAERYAALAELAADEAAVAATGRSHLASALLALGAAADAPGVVRIAPERVDHLGGQPARWRLSVAGFVASLALVALALASAASVATVLGGATIDVPIVLAQSCMPLMFAAPALLLGWGVHLAAPRLKVEAARRTPAA